MGPHELQAVREHPRLHDRVLQAIAAAPGKSLGMQDRRVLVTGGTGGLGVPVLKAVLARGGRVTATYHDDVELGKAEKGLTHEEFASVTFVRADVMVEDDVRRVYAGLEKVEVVMHLVGGFAMGPTSAQTLDAWKGMLALNLTSTFLVCKHALAPIRQGGYGRIVTVGSRAAVSPPANAAAYAASKAGVVALTHAIAEELRGIDATANCILPSTIDTPLNRGSMPQADYSKWVAPESLAEVICFLGSAAARDLRGVAIPVYGRA
jgi:NAD(P)-dependent dehydrogenase (short-subunit alcohol dehydrogenase family)